MKRHFWVAAWLALCLPARAENPPCEKVASADMLAHWGAVPVVAAAMAGKQTELLFSTGNQQSYVFQRWQDETGQPSLPVPKFALETDGKMLTHYIAADDLTLGGVRFPGSAFLVLPNLADSEPHPSVLGLDFMYRYNLDFDFAARKVTLFTSEHCTPDPIFRAAGATILPFRYDQGRRPVAKVKLNGQELLARLETGRTSTLMGLETARELFGINEMSLVHTGDRYEYTFKTLQLGGITLTDGKILLVSEVKSPYFHEGSPLKWIKLDIGAELLQQLRVYMAYRQGAYYLAPR